MRLRGLLKGIFPARFSASGLTLLPSFESAMPAVASKDPRYEIDLLILSK